MRGDERLLAVLSQIFIEDCPQRLEAIRQAAQSGDAAALMRSAHNLKGALALFGAPAAVEAARRLEHQGRTGDLSRSAIELSVLQREAGALVTALAGES
jgi:HPt (histidine-containing phosphotransfer) domain-containing protein